jgi:hypothetical protein
MNFQDLLKEQFNNRIGFVPRRPNVTQLVLPLYYEDGDMVDIFLETPPQNGGRVRICDHGMALMRLSYSYDLNTAKKNEILERILGENQATEERGNICMDVAPEMLYPALLQFAQTVAKVASMRYFRREVIASLFFEMLEEFVMTKLARFRPQKAYFPLPEHEEYEVDYCFNGRPRPIYLFGVNSPSTARLAALSCQKFIIDKMTFRSLVVLEDLDVLGKKDQARLMAAADKEYPSLDAFREKGAEFLQRELV